MTINYSKLYDIILNGYKEYPEMFKLMEKDPSEEDYDLNEVDREAIKRNAAYSTSNFIRDLDRIPELREYLKENL